MHLERQIESCAPCQLSSDYQPSGLSLIYSSEPLVQPSQASVASCDRVGSGLGFYKPAAYPSHPLQAEVQVANDACNKQQQHTTLAFLSASR